MTTQYIPDLIGEVVSEVNEVFSTREENPFNVYYDWGHDLEVIRNLSAKDKSLSKPKKYPLVWFVMNFKESMGNIGLYAKLNSVQMYIMMDTRVNYSMAERRDTTFLPILYPVYAELIKQISLSDTFRTISADQIQHTKIDMPYWSKDGSSNFYNDFIDAIQIADLKLDVKRLPKNCIQKLKTT